MRQLVNTVSFQAVVFWHLKGQNIWLWGVGPKALQHCMSFDPGYFIALHLGRKAMHYVLGKGKSEQRLGCLVKIVSKWSPVSVSNSWRLSRNWHQCAPHSHYGKELSKPGRKTIYLIKLINTKAVLWISCLKSILILTYYPFITTKLKPRERRERPHEQRKSQAVTGDCVLQCPEHGALASATRALVFPF